MKSKLNLPDSFVFCITLFNNTIVIDNATAKVIMLNIKNKLNSKLYGAIIILFRLKLLYINLFYPENIKNILKIIEVKKSIKTRDLSFKAKIGGAKLRDILDFLTKEGVIQEQLISGDGAGRPRRIYSIVEKES